MVTLLLAAGYLPRECFNVNGDPKIRHKTREAAIAHKRNLLRATGDSGWSRKVYRCRVCGFWHVGRSGARRRRGGRR
jgi:rubrerythrin